MRKAMALSVLALVAAGCKSKEPELYTPLGIGTEVMLYDEKQGEWGLRPTVTGMPQRGSIKNPENIGKGVGVANGTAARVIDDINRRDGLGEVGVCITEGPHAGEVLYFYAVDLRPLPKR